MRLFDERFTPSSPTARRAAARDARAAATLLEDYLGRRVSSFDPMTEPLGPAHGRAGLSAEHESPLTRRAPRTARPGRACDDRGGRRRRAGYGRPSGRHPGLRRRRRSRLCPRLLLARQGRSRGHGDHPAGRHLDTHRQATRATRAWWRTRAPSSSRPQSDGYSTQFKPGTYRFHKNEPYNLLVAGLLKGARPATVKVTIPEGFTRARRRRPWWPPRCPA